jgi:putative transposase
VVASDPPVRRNHKGGRPPTPDRVVLSGILYRLRTGCQWEAIPKEFGSGSTCYRRFRKWQQAHVFELMHREMLRYYDDKVGLEWDWTSLDSASKSAKRGDLTGPKPTDRAKLGTKRHVLTDGKGIPLGVTLTGANVRDKHMCGKTLDAVVLKGSRGPRRPKNLCLDKDMPAMTTPARRSSPHQAHQRDGSRRR